MNNSVENDIYKKKYLKYKYKYKYISNQLGGVKCPNFGFTNTDDTCMINSLLMLFLYTDGLKEIIQSKLDNIPDIDLYIDQIPANKNYLLPFNYEYCEIDEYKILCKKYLKIIKQRFNNKFDQTKQIMLKRQTSIICSGESEEILNILGKHNNIKGDIYFNDISLSLIKLFNYSLLFDNKNIIYYKNNIENLSIGNILGVNIFISNSKSKSEIGHSIFCFTCNSIDYYYDSNGVTRGSTVDAFDHIKFVRFDWRRHIRKSNEQFLEEIKKLYNIEMIYAEPAINEIHYYYFDKNTNEENYFSNKLYFTDILKDFNNKRTLDILFKFSFIKHFNHIKDINDDEFICEFNNIISDIDTYDNLGETLFTTIIKNKLYSIYNKMIRLKLLDKLDLNKKNLKDEHPLFLCYQQEYYNEGFFNLVITNKKININDQIDSNNNTLLDTIVFYKDYATLIRLLEVPEINLKTKDIYGNTPLHYAFQGSDIKIIKSLLDFLLKNKETYKDGILFKNNKGLTPIYLTKDSISKKLFNDTNTFLKSRP